mmetsp:Transcript_17155/g.41137  ORF Transcript_17155/g.41137 Transcript_17155/m.41137 type:complete len:221 (-) Transcript_17155:1974-2636(-)
MSPCSCTYFTPLAIWENRRRANGMSTAYPLCDDDCKREPLRAWWFAKKSAKVWTLQSCIWMNRMCLPSVVFFSQSAPFVRSSDFTFSLKSDLIVDSLALFFVLPLLSTLLIPELGWLSSSFKVSSLSCLESLDSFSVFIEGSTLLSLLRSHVNPRSSSCSCIAASFCSAPKEDEASDFDSSKRRLPKLFHPRGLYDLKNPLVGRWWMLRLGLEDNGMALD